MARAALNSSCSNQHLPTSGGLRSSLEEDDVPEFLPLSSVNAGFHAAWVDQIVSNSAVTISLVG